MNYIRPQVVKIEPNHGPTLGGVRITVFGSDLGELRCPFAVNLNGQGGVARITDSSVSQFSPHKAAVFELPAGMGRNKVVSVVVDQQNSLQNHQVLNETEAKDILFSYDAPVIDRVSPEPVDARGSQLLSIIGKNFGSDISETRVEISNVDCSHSRWISDSEIQCMTEKLEIGYVSLFIDVAEQNASVSADSGRIRAFCMPGYFGRVGENCTGCPTGAICSGYESDPVASAGFFEVSHRFRFVKCNPLEACVGGEGSPCDPKYRGYMCSACAEKQ